MGGAAGTDESAFDLMSANGTKADMRSRRMNVRYSPPKADVGGRQLDVRFALKPEVNDLAATLPFSVHRHTRSAMPAGTSSLTMATIRGPSLTNLDHRNLQSTARYTALATGVHSCGRTNPRINLRRFPRQDWAVTNRSLPRYGVQVVARSGASNCARWRPISRLALAIWAAVLWKVGSAL